MFELKRLPSSTTREENASRQPSASGSEDLSQEYSRRATRRLTRKIDLALLPFLALLYLNIGNARIAADNRMEKDLKMKGLDYNIALAIFFPFYVLVEIPSNIMMKRFRPSIWIPSIMVVWGVMCCLMGIVKNFAGLIAIRAALGIAEGGLFPGINFYITMWYKRHECGFRMALFFSAATAAGAFGGLLARGISQLDGKRGLAAWSWIFIIEGSITTAIALLAYFFMHDYPDTAKFLTMIERVEVKRRLEEDRSSLDESFKAKYVWDAIGDWKIWVNMLITIGIFSPLYSFSLFLPTIIKDLGYSDNQAQLMTVPPYIVACFFCIWGGWLGDRHGQRGIYLIGCNLLAIVGFIILIATKEAKLKYLGTFFGAAGIYPNVPQIVAWNGNNIGGSTKRSVGIAMQVAFGNLGGIVSSFTYLAKDGPMYHRGHGIVIGLLTMSTILCYGMRVWFGIENFKRDAVDTSAGRGKGGSGWTITDKKAQSEMGDKAGFFRYTI